MQIINFVISHWVEWLFCAVTAILSFGYRNVSKKVSEEKDRNEAVAAGVQCLLRESIVGNYNKYNDAGYCPIYAKESIKSAYAAYHQLGGNDVATTLYNSLLEMPSEPPTEY